jgi:hypothetical protein
MTTLRLTYEELGERIGCSAEGARMLARRRRWRVEKGNDGKARVLVDETALVVRPTGRPPGHDQPPPETAETEALRAQVLALTERAARAEGENAVLHAALERERVQAEERAAALRELIDELKQQLSRERGRRREAEARLARPWWKRWFA